MFFILETFNVKDNGRISRSVFAYQEGFTWVSVSLPESD